MVVPAIALSMTLEVYLVLSFFVPALRMSWFIFFRERSSQSIRLRWRFRKGYPSGLRVSFIEEGEAER